MSAGSTSTIAAIATPPGPARRGIVRASGPACAALVRATTGLDPERDLPPRAWDAIEFDDGRGRQPGWLLWMRGPRSLTGEDVAEFHLPGNAALLRAAFERLLVLGATSAGPGEFTRRAFQAGKIDLTRAEGVLLLVSAEDDAERRAGSLLLAGGLARAVDLTRASLSDLRALCEASLDFDESDTGHVPTAELAALFETARETIARALGDQLARPTERGSARIVLAGAANAGKSQLFNALLAAEERDEARATLEQTALVSAHAGTTRDTLAARLDCGGIEAVLVDTAGLSDDVGRAGDLGLADNAAGLDGGVGQGASGALEREAQVRSRREHAAAEVVLWVVDAGAVRPEEASGAAPWPRAARVLLVWNKLDLPGAPAEPPRGWREAPGVEGWVGVSGRTGLGLGVLRERIAASLARRSAGLSRELAARHAAALERAAAELEVARRGVDAGWALELVAEHLRQACSALDDVCGWTTPEDVLARIFARFCIGK